jgi:hypothetical protein
MRRSQRLNSWSCYWILDGHKDGDAAYKHKNNVRAGAPDLRDGELDEIGLDEIGEEEFFCKNFLLMLTALNFFGCGAERPVELPDPDAMAVMIVGRIVGPDCGGATEGPSATFSSVSMVVSGACCGTAAVDVTSRLTPSDPKAPVSSRLVNSDSPGVSVSIFAIDASQDAMLLSIPCDWKFVENQEKGCKVQIRGQSSDCIAECETYQGKYGRRNNGSSVQRAQY